MMHGQQNIKNGQIILTINITVLGCEAVRFGRDESRKKPVDSISMLKNEGRNITRNFDTHPSKYMASYSGKIKLQ
jgi:hypothetical protein